MFRSSERVASLGDMPDRKRNGDGQDRRGRTAPARGRASRLRVGIIELLVDTPAKSPLERLYATHFRKQFVGIMPQTVSAWCRELGHEVTYATYCGQPDPLALLPGELDVVFISAYTQASALAYALARVYRGRRTLTVLGGPHAKSFPEDAARFFDLVVKECDKPLLADILRGRFDPPAIITSGHPLEEFASVEEREPEIAAAAFHRGRPLVTSLVPILASVGCPYACDFCTDWNKDYRPVPRERLLADLRHVSRKWPGLLIGFHDPNFAVRFDETMDLIEEIPRRARNPYIMESSLSILKGSRLHRLRETNCVYVAPGIESWGNYSSKSGVGILAGRDKLERVVAHMAELFRFVPGIQANFILGTDVDEGSEPVEFTKEFIRSLPFVWPSVNIPCPFGGTPLFDRYLAEGRILRAMPFAFYYVPYLPILLRHYAPLEYYDHLIGITEEIVRLRMLARRLKSAPHPALALIHALRTLGTRGDLAEYRRVRSLLAADPQFRAFHEGRSDHLPAFYHRRFEERLGRFADLLPRHLRAPLFPDAAQLPTFGGRPRVPEASVRPGDDRRRNPCKPCHPLPAAS